MYYRNDAAQGHNDARILIIDGVQSIGVLYATILRMDGYTVHTAASILEAKSSLAAYRPDAVIVAPDQFSIEPFKLDELSDLKLAESAIPVLVISAQRTSSLISIPFVTECLFLPFKMNQLRGCVACLIGSTSASASSFMAETQDQPSISPIFCNGK